MTYSFYCGIILVGGFIMESKQILEILEQFNDNNTYKKIFINGVWGN